MFPQMLSQLSALTMSIHYISDMIPLQVYVRGHKKKSGFENNNEDNEVTSNSHEDARELRE